MMSGSRNWATRIANFKNRFAIWARLGKISDSAGYTAGSRKPLPRPATTHMTVPRVGLPTMMIPAKDATSRRAPMTAPSLRDTRSAMGPANG